MNQPFSFNLTKEPWIPCIQADGTQVDLNLHDVFAQAHRLRAIAGESPPVTVALHRFLLAILHRVLGPENYEAWEELWLADSWDMTSLGGYLDTWQHRFDLLDAEHPFYQAADERMRTKSTISLSHDRASGNNPTLFDHHTEEDGESLTPAQAVRALLAAQSYGLAGLSGITQKFTDGTCASGIIFLVQGDNLKQTLLLNMIQYPSNDFFQNIHTRHDKPAWEMDDPFVPNRANPFGYLDYLTWQNRRVLFVPEQTPSGVVIREMTMGPALRYDSAVLDPMKNYRKDDKLGFLTVGFSENRVFWRDSASLFSFRDDMLGKGRPPMNFKWLKELVDENILSRHHTYRTLAVGMSKKQAKVFFFRQEQFLMPLEYLTSEHLVEKLNTALALTGTVAFDLVQTARLMGMHQQVANVEDKGWQKQWGGLNINAKSAINDWIAHTGMERAYWSSLDIPFQSFIVDLAKDQEQALVEWFAQLQNAALTAFDQATACVGNDGRSFKAAVRGHGYLVFRLAEVLPDPKSSK